jgi:hypothetical protein
MDKHTVKSLNMQIWYMHYLEFHECAELLEEDLIEELK